MKAVTNAVRLFLPWILPLQTVEVNDCIIQYIDRLHQEWWDEQNTKYRDVQPHTSRRPFFIANSRRRCNVNRTVFQIGRHPDGNCDL